MTELKQDLPPWPASLRNQSEQPKSTLLSTFEWQCRMRAAAGKHINRMQLWMFTGATGMAAIPLLAQWANDLGHLDDSLMFSAMAYAAMAVFLPMVRQKTVYNYRINDECGECESYLYFPSYAGALFNGIAILSFVAVFAAAVMMQSLIPLLDAGAVGLGYTGQLLGWKPTINNEKSLPWKEYGFITLDYKRKMIVAHRTDITLGFELRCFTEQRFEECLAFLRTVLRPDVEFLERDWDADGYPDG